MNPRSVVVAATRSSADVSTEDKVFDAVLADMMADKDHFWTSVEIFGRYQCHDGKLLTRRALVQKLSDHFGPELLILCAKGLANLLVLRSAGRKILRLEEDDDDDISVGNVAKTIQRESKDLCPKQNEYKLRINKDS